MKWRPYPKYKNSGIEWLGDVPEGWEGKQVRYLAGINQEVLPENTSPDYFFHYVDIGSVDKIAGITETQPIYFEDAPSRARRIARYNDCIISTVRTYLQAITSIPEHKEQLVVSTGFAVVRPQKIHERYLFWAIKNQAFIERITAYSTGVSYPAISALQLSKFEIPFPSFVEQKTIAAFLDKETDRIDALIAKKKALIEKLKEQRIAIISNAVTKGLPADVAPRYGLKPHTHFKPSGVDWLGEVPESWRCASLRWLSKIYSGGTPDKSNPDFWSDGTIPWLNSGAVNQNKITKPSNFITQEGFSSSSAKWIPRYALLMALAGQGKTKGMVAQLMFEATCNQSMAAIIPTSVLTSRYLFWWLTSNYQNIRNLGGGDNRDGLNLVLLGNIYCPIPKQDEQKAIAAYLDEQTGKIDALIVKLEQAITTLQEYRTALITAAVTGKIDVRHEAGMQEIS